MQKTAISIRLDPAMHNELLIQSRARRITVSDLIRERLKTENSEQTNILAVIASEIDEQRQQIADVQATLSAILDALEHSQSGPNPARQERTTPPPQATAPAQQKPSPSTPPKTATGEAWGSWITRQGFIEADNDSPAARGRRLWQQFEAETGNEAPAQFRSSPPSR